MKDSILAEIAHIDSVLPKEYDMDNYKADMEKVRRDYDSYKETNSFTLATLVYVHNTSDFKRKYNLLLLLGKITYDPEYVLTEKDHTLFKLKK